MALRSVARLPTCPEPTGSTAFDLPPPRREPLVALAAFALVSAAGAAALAGVIGGEATGVSFGDNANSAICDEMMASIGSTRSQDYSQCVSDLFSG